MGREISECEQHQVWVERDIGEWLPLDEEVNWVGEGVFILLWCCCGSLKKGKLYSKCSKIVIFHVLNLSVGSWMSVRVSVLLFMCEILNK